MADANKKKYVKTITPVIPLRYVRVFEVDYGTEKYPKPNGQYSLQGILDPKNPDHAVWMAKMQPHYEAALRNAKEAFDALPRKERDRLKEVKPNPLFSPIYDKTTDEPTGELYFKATKTYKFVDKKTKKEKFFPRPDVFDSLKRPISEEIPIWSGTKARVALSFDPDGTFIAGTGAAGLNFKLDAIQIVELQGPNGSRSADSYGFEEEDGFGSDADTDASPAADAEDDF